MAAADQPRRRGPRGAPSSAAAVRIVAIATAAVLALRLARCAPRPPHAPLRAARVARALHCRRCLVRRAADSTRSRPTQTALIRITARPHNPLFSFVQAAPSSGTATNSTASLCLAHAVDAVLFARCRCRRVVFLRCGLIPKQPPRAPMTSLSRLFLLCGYVWQQRRVQRRKAPAL